MNRPPFFPDQASTLAPGIDNIYFMWTALSVVVSLIIAVLIVIFAIRYRTGSAADRRSATREEQERILKRVEFAWQAVPMAIFVAMFFWSTEIYYRSVSVPANAIPVYVVGKQWMWHLEHAGGQREIDELHVPLGQPVELIMTSQDVLHSFSIPGFRVKQDVLPGRYTTIWFEATRAGDFHLFCTQFCGADHSRMVGRVVVLPPADFEKWLAARAGGGTMAAQGQVRFREFGCSGCHGPNAAVRAPRLEGLFGRPVRLQDGQTAVADERFIRDAVFTPNRSVPAGYDATMPSYRGQMNEEQLLEIIAYVKSMRDLPQGELP